MTKIKLLTATAAGALAATGLASAQVVDPVDRPYQDDPSGFYVGGGYTFIDIETDNDIDALDDQGDSTNALTIRGGYQITPVFGVEVDGTFGIDDGDFDLDGDEIDLDDLDQIDENADRDNIDEVIAGAGDIGLDYLVGAYAKVGFPVNEKFTVSGRVGYAFAEVDATNEFSLTNIDDAGTPDDDSDDVLTTTTTSQSFGGSDDGFAFGASGRYNINDSNAIRADYTRYNFGDANADAITISYQYTFGGPGFGY